MFQGLPNTRRLSLRTVSATWLYVTKFNTFVRRCDVSAESSQITNVRDNRHWVRSSFDDLLSPSSSATSYALRTGWKKKFISRCIVYTNSGAFLKRRFPRSLAVTRSLGYDKEIPLAIMIFLSPSSRPTLDLQSISGYYTKSLKSHIAE